MEKKILDAKKAIDESLEEIQIIKLSNLTIYKEKLSRWKDRTVLKIKDKISDNESKSFNDKKFMSHRGLSMDFTEQDYMFESTTYYIDILTSLRDEITNHPNSILNPMSMPTSKRWEHYFELMNPKVIEFSKKQFIDGYISESVFSSFKEINVMVKNKYRTSAGLELDGKDLMMKAFGSEAPVIKLTDLDNITDNNIQEGYRFIFAGAMVAIRNPKAHDKITISEERGIHLLFLASLLFDKLNEAVN
ncbi:MAG: TIGR02391 family protein [Bacteriovorax sp.]|jgi:uncharacterized protein (TIGR02391 family)